MKMIRDEDILLIVAAAYLIMTLWYYPSFYASIDEHEYIRNAFLLQKGSLEEQEITKSCIGKFNGDGYVSQFFIGRSLFTIPFTWGGLPLIMASGMVIHLINFLIIVLIFRRLSYRSLYASLYLFYPLFLWESRTINSELLVLTGVLVGTFFYTSTKRVHHIISGFVFTLTLLVRLDAAFLVAGFYLTTLVKERKKFTSLVIGSVPMLFILLTVNSLLYGGALKTGYGSPLSFILDLGSNPLFGWNILKYLALLSLAYPLMLFSPWKGRLRWETCIGGTFFLLFYAQNSFIAAFPSFHPTVVTSQLRYILPLAGLLFLSYPVMVEEIIKRLRLPTNIVIPVIVVMIGVGVIASSVHASFLDGRASVSEFVLHTIPEGSLTVGSSDDCNYFLPEVFGDRAYIDVSRSERDNVTATYQDVYFLNISYGTVDYTSIRGEGISKERERMRQYIDSQNTVLIAEIATPHRVNVYKRLA